MMILTGCPAMPPWALVQSCQATLTAVISGTDAAGEEIVLSCPMTIVDFWLADAPL